MNRSSNLRSNRAALGENNIMKDVDQVAQRLKDAKAKAEQERLAPPIPVPYIEPEDLRQAFNAQRAKFDDMMATGDMLRQTYIGDYKTMSTTPLHLLDPIRLEDMAVRKHHKGNYLLCRIITKPSRIVCVMIGIEDENGWAHLVSLYNFPYADTMGGAELDTLFPLNAVLAIREPYPKMALTGPSSHIRVESPSDIVFLDSDDPLVRRSSWETGYRTLPIKIHTDVEWKAIGDSHFKKKQFFAAAVAYSYALKRDGSVCALRLNRALAYLRLDRHYQALTDAKAVIELPDIDKADRVKALYRAGLAAYGQSDYEAAKDWYSKCLDQDPTLSEAKIGVEKCNARIQEALTGEYDWIALYKQGLSSPCRPDVASYTGPFQIVQMESRGGGRGGIATKDIKTGDVLLVWRAFTSAFKEDYYHDKLVQVLNFLTGAHESSTKFSLIQRTIGRIAESSVAAAELYDLYAGSNMPKYSEIKSSLSNIDTDGDPFKFATDIDVSRIEAISSLNSFNITPPKKASFVIDTEDGEDTPTGLFTTPALFNHSCIPNTKRVCYGDIMVFRATQNIAAGEEITLMYASGESYQLRQSRLAKHFEECDCSLCQADRTDGPNRCTERTSLLAQAMATKEATISSAKRLVTAIENAYLPERTAPRLALGNAHHRLAYAMDKAAVSAQGAIQLRLWKESIVEEMAALEANGAVVLDKGTGDLSSQEQSTYDVPVDNKIVPYNPEFCTFLCLSITASFCSIHIQWRAKRWLKTAVWIQNSILGGGIQLFKIRYVDVLKSFGTEVKTLLKEVEESGWKP